MKHVILDNSEILRFSRHLLLPEVGIEGQQYLKDGNVLIVGAGGLGCPILLYLASAGIGNITIVDEDTVSVENLHRQILYSDMDIGRAKAQVAKDIASRRNSNLICKAYVCRLTWANALDIFEENKKPYDIIIDASDNYETCYLINDLSLYKNIPWIYGSALAFEGHIATFNYHPDKTSLCYRCLFPEPPPINSLMGCNERGVLGVIPGIIGMLQALEAQKILIKNLIPSYHQKMLIFDALSSTTLFKEIKIRSKKIDCLSCSKIPNSSLTSEQFKRLGDTILKSDLSCPSIKTKIKSISVTAMVNTLSSECSSCLCILDVREKHELKICTIPISETMSLINVPFSSITKRNGVELLESSLLPLIKNSDPTHTHSFIILVICRRGKDSSLTVQILNEHPVFKDDMRLTIYNVEGGLHAWHNTIDPTYPLY